MARELEPRERILAAGKHLFARKGFAGTGVREIASRAGVNLAMINYYFGSKEGLLQAITESYFDRVFPGAAEAVQSEGGAREIVRKIAAVMIGVLRDDPEILRILLNRLPLEPDGLSGLPRERFELMFGLISQKLVPLLEAETGHRIGPQLLVPAMVGLIAGHFLFRNQLETLPGIEFEADFYDRMPDLVVQVLFDGFSGLETDSP
ncbi:MAG: TetR family transcriptional regulator [Deltaproteobacteria bacterium]|nr:TetR family transcriptional regulator [Deltaproteobacteria bacterium]